MALEDLVARDDSDRTPRALAVKAVALLLCALALAGCASTDPWAGIEEPAPSVSTVRVVDEQGRIEFRSEVASSWDRVAVDGNGDHICYAVGSGGAATPPPCTTTMGDGTTPAGDGAITGSVLTVCTPEGGVAVTVTLVHLPTDTRFWSRALTTTPAC